MRSCVMRMNEIGPPVLDALYDFSRGTEIPIPGGPDRGNGQTDCASASEKRRIRGGDYEGFVTCVSLGTCQEIDLPLTAPPGLSHVDVQYPQRHRDKVATGVRWGNAEHRILHEPQPVQNRVVTLMVGWMG